MKLNIEYAKSFVEFNQDEMQKRVNKIHEMIHQEEKPSDFLGWLDIPVTEQKDLLGRIKKTAERIRKNSQVLVVVGIGGSYAGSKAGIEFLDKPFAKQDIEVLYAGHNMSGRYLKNLLEYLKDKDFSVNVISKSGTTTEPAIAFRVLKNELIKRYGKNYAERVIATTDGKKGSLHELSKNEGYEMYVIPDSVGGRFSVLTPVGLLPFAVKGYDIDAILEGAKDIYTKSLNPDLNKNDVYLYAVMRYLLYVSGKKIEMLVNYDPNLGFFAEWWKQLFGESEGKDGKGLFVASANFSTDLHSLGQYIQEGERHLFETVLKINEINDDVIIEKEDNDLDNLNYLAGKSIKYVNEKAIDGTILAHVDGNVPNMLIEVKDISEHTFGQMIYFFELACAMSAYLLDVDPFNQPGVEKYKKNMFALLGKKGYENVLKK
ncbi:glucose-6-phosphate isomerase [Haploplasma axanthum]|uniref:Glucose-6-phosphate isomerase n=1 Tax=Haploplasma axanthum TaxID=29552 RepID=A0A449BFF9_HAPAX|nr:glucose-6-phosphate isomerase [Haploplasma axanthum]VEU81155.1 Glucose-6-phosphate isomerase [Haploplasma axanthum]